jgi:hypothetical protein
MDLKNISTNVPTPVNRKQARVGAGSKPALQHLETYYFSKKRENNM